jgi:hypothetical protein
MVESSNSRLGVCEEPVSGTNVMDVRYEQYVGEERDLEAMMTLVDQELSEP